MIIYKTFPIIPKHIIDKVLDIALNINFSTNDFNLTTDNSNLLESIKEFTPDLNDNVLGVAFNEAQQYYKERIASFAFINPPKELTEWVKENITIPYRGVNIQVMSGGNFVAPHIDEIRNGALNYIIQTGGPDVKTKLYKPKTEYANLKVTPQTIFLYDTIDEVHSETLPTNKWHILDVTQIHSVNDLDPLGIRISISVSL
jgi:hypothetical protein